MAHGDCTRSLLIFTAEDAEKRMKDEEKHLDCEAFIIHNASFLFTSPSSALPVRN
jgi:uncharacterized protein YebE (UPF0316 family)